MSKSKAVVLNIVADCFAFIGLYIGINIAEKGECCNWILAIIAGMFTYLSLVDLVSYFKDF